MGFDDIEPDKDAIIAGLRNRLRLFEAVIGHFPAGILLADKNLRVVLCNAQQRALLEYPEEFFTMGSPTLEELFRFNSARGEYGSGDIEEIVTAKMQQVERRQYHAFECQRPNGAVWRCGERRYQKADLLLPT